MARWNKGIYEKVLGNVYERWTVIDDNIPKELWGVKARKVLCRCSCKDKTERLVGVCQLKNSRGLSIKK